MYVFALNRPLVVDYSPFGDTVTIIRKSQHFGLRKTGYEKDFRRIQKLRDAMAHANDYAASREAATKTCQTVRLIEDCKARLSHWPCCDA